MTNEDLARLRKLAAIWKAQEGLPGPDVNFVMDHLGDLIARLDHAEPLVDALREGQIRLRAEVQRLRRKLVLGGKR